MIFRIIAFCILAAFYGCYYTKVLIQREKGITTDHIGKGKEGLVKRIEMLMKLSAVLAPIAEAASIILDANIMPAAGRIAGAVIGTLGVIVFAVSVITMRDNWRAGVSEDKTELVTNGIYGLSRNPAFLGFDLVYIGILMMFCNIVLLVFVVFAAQMLHLQIIYCEEESLKKAFGDEYLEYMKKVNRYFGRK